MINPSKKLNFCVNIKRVQLKRNPKKANSYIGRFLGRRPVGRKGKNGQIYTYLNYKTDS